MSTRENIAKIFTGITELDDDVDIFKFNNISVRNYDPPAYIVRIILIDVLGLRDCGPMDKVRWHTVFSYKDKTFMMRDYKFGSWSIESDTNDEQTHAVVSELKRKIKIAANNLEPLTK